MSYGGGSGRYNSPLSGLSGSALYTPGALGGSPSSLHLPNSGYRDSISPSRALLSGAGGYPLSSSYSSASVPSSSLYGSPSLALSHGRTGLYSPSTASSSLLEVPGSSSGSRSPRSPRSLSPSPGYSRFRPSAGSASGVKTFAPSSSSTLSPAGYSLASSRSASSIAPTSTRRTPLNSTTTSSDRYRSRYGSSGSAQDGKDSSRLSDRSRTSSQTSLNSSTSSLNEDVEKDYKKLYNDVREENDRLKIKLKKTEEELEYAKRQLEKLMQNNKNSLSDVEKRERRAIERRLSEMEEESKEMERLLADNQRLRDENGALIRVISKLSK